MAQLRERLQEIVGTGYRVERELGGGGMSRVFLAEEVALERQVVIEVLPPEMAVGVNADRFRREILLAAKLQHPHVVPLLTAGSGGDLLYYVMPFIKGEALRARLAREGELPLADTVRILRDVAEALAFAHAEGVVHRDSRAALFRAGGPVAARRSGPPAHRDQRAGPAGEAHARGGVARHSRAGGHRSSRLRRDPRGPRPTIRGTSAAQWLSAPPGGGCSDSGGTGSADRTSP